MHSFASITTSIFPLSGPAVLDFEQWQPTLRSTGVLKYREFSKMYHQSLVKAGATRHPRQLNRETAANLTVRSADDCPGPLSVVQLLRGPDLCWVSGIGHVTGI